MKLKEQVLTAMSAALLAVISQISIPVPFSAVPLTFQLVAITILSIILPLKLSVLSIFLYILLGAFGLPVFSGFSGGLNTLVGPTGGYIIGFILISLLVSLGSKNNNLKVLYSLSYLGIVADYVLGTIQLKLSLHITLYQAFLTGVMPFIIKDVVLVSISISLGFAIKNALQKSHITV